MAIFSKKIVSTKFIDPPINTIIEVLYQENDSVIPYILEVDFTNDEFNDLLKEVPLDEIEENTKRILKSQSDIFEKMINDEIDRRWAVEQEKIKKAYEEAEEDFSNLRKDLQNKFARSGQTMSSEINAKDLLSIIDSKDQDNDFLFNAKIAILEDPIIGKSKDKKLKLSIRKSKSLWELFKIYTSARE